MLKKVGNSVVVVLRISVKDVDAGGSVKRKVVGASVVVESVVDIALVVLLLSRVHLL